MKTIINSSQWYVLKAIFKKELAVRDALQGDGLQCYVPLTYRVQTQQGRKVRRLVAAISELVFVRGTEDEIAAHKAQLRETVYWLTRPVMGQEKREKIVVPDKAMEDFMRVTEQHERLVTYFRPEEIALNRGDHIRIHGGVFDGVEGTLLKVKGRRERQLVVTIPGLAVAAVAIRPDVIELTDKNAVSSVSSAKDLIRIAKQLLTAPPDPDANRHEWNLLHREMKAQYDILRSRKGFLPSAEAEIALSLLLAERAMGGVTPETIDRCRQAATRLRNTSHLKTEILELISYLSPLTSDH